MNSTPLMNPSFISENSSTRAKFTQNRHCMKDRTASGSRGFFGQSDKADRSPDRLKGYCSCVAA